MRKASAWAAVAVLLAAAPQVAAPDLAWGAAADVSAAARAFTAGAHVFVAVGAAPLHRAALTKAISKETIFVAALPRTGTDPTTTEHTLAELTRIDGTYVVVDGTDIRAGSNTLPNNGVESVRLAAVAKHPGNVPAAVDEIVQNLISGDAKIAAPGDATSVTTGATADVTAVPARTTNGLSPWFALVLLPLFATLAFAVRRARRGQPPA